MNTIEPPMTGKICIVTGGTSGIGKVTALALSRLGATTILVARDTAKGAAVVNELKTLTGNPGVHFLAADLSSQAQIRRLSEQFRQHYTRLDLLVNNAGVMLTKSNLSVDGIEMTFAINHLSYFLLTNLLLDVLQSSAPARIVNVASGLHAMATLDWDDLQSTKNYSPLKAYNRSKLANLLFTYELARRLGGTTLTVNAADPGFARTNLYSIQNLGFIPSALTLLTLPFAHSAASGARTVIQLATAPELANVTGKYFESDKEVLSSAASRDSKDAARLWQISMELTG
jgi:NAD(P)-dependent dehydrogenase (short-subunit alcohol dehydrogenase family)